MTRRGRPFLTLLLLSAPLAAQEFELGIVAPEALRRNSAFEAMITLTSRGLPPDQRGVQGWSLSVAHEGLSLLSVTTAGTAVDEHFDRGFLHSEVTTSTVERPRNDGFVSAVILGQVNPSATLPPQGVAVLARASYHVGELACFDGARLQLADGLKGSGEPIVNVVTWQNRTHVPVKTGKSYPGCLPNDYRLHLAAPPGPLRARLGERIRFSVETRLAQSLASASAVSLAVGHDPASLSLVGVGIQGTGMEELIQPGGFALLEVTSGPANAGFTALIELPADPGRAIPAPDHPLVAAEYEMAPVTDPRLVGSTIEVPIRFAASLQGSGGRISNQVTPPGNLTTEDPALRVEIAAPPGFIRGDANSDGMVNVADPVAVLFAVYLGIGEVCAEAGNSNDDARLDLTDAIFTLEGLFVRPAPLPPPGPGCGIDSTFPSLACDRGGCP